MNRVTQALRQLGIVILGVVIALAADSWREGFLEDRIESEYLSRLRSDLSLGVLILQGERGRFASVRDAAWAVIEALENEEAGTNNDLLVKNLVAATMMGFDRQEMGSDVTYRELVESGQLNILSDYEIREGIVAYYRQVDRLAENLEGLPQVNATVGSLTGYLPIEFVHSGVELSDSGRSRLLKVVREDPELSMQLRLLHAQLVFSDREFEQVVERAQQLMTLIEGVIEE